jgi:hypothetical protein
MEYENVKNDPMSSLFGTPHTLKTWAFIYFGPKAFDSLISLNLWVYLCIQGLPFFLSNLSIFPFDILKE